MINLVDENREKSRQDGEPRTRLRQVMLGRYLGYLAADAAALTAGFFLALMLGSLINELLLDRTYMDGLILAVDRRMGQFGSLAFCLLLIFHMLGHYQRPLPRWTVYRHVAGAVLLLMMADGFVFYAVREHHSRLWLVNSWLLGGALIPVMRGAARRILDRRGLWTIPAIMVGSGPQLAHVRQALASEPTLGYGVVDTVPLSHLEETGAEGAWPRLFRDKGGAFVILALSAEEMVRHGERLTDLVRERLPFAVVPSLGGLPILGFDQLSFVGQDFMMMVARNNLGQPFSRSIKFLFDIIVSLALVVVLLPVFLLFSALIASDGGPVIYRHRRVGRNGLDFMCFKFRTMVPDAEAVLARHLAAHPAAADEWAAFRKLSDDPRITRVGRFLRSTSLDELPQLVNVLRGEMSLVGPRPVTREELPHYGRDLFFYLEARPGITGLWQVSGRSSLSFDQRVLYDTWYVKNWTLWLDVTILTQTIPVVLNRTGAV